MPLIDVTYDQALGERVLRELAELLPGIVAEAVDCPEEPWIGPPEPGDIEIRFRQKSLLDVGELDVVIEVRTNSSRIASRTSNDVLICFATASRVWSSAALASG